MWKRQGFLRRILIAYYDIGRMARVASRRQQFYSVQPLTLCSYAGACPRTRTVDIVDLRLAPKRTPTGSALVNRNSRSHLDYNRCQSTLPHLFRPPECPQEKQHPVFPDVRLLFPPESVCGRSNEPPRTTYARYISLLNAFFCSRIPFLF